MGTIHEHATVRAQQRCIPPVVELWLAQFGEEEHDGHGGIRVYFSRRSVREMERTFGRHFVQQNRKYLQIYKVESSRSGAVITAGWRTRHMRRR